MHCLGLYAYAMHVCMHCHSPNNYNIVMVDKLVVKPDHRRRYRDIITELHTIVIQKKFQRFKASSSTIFTLQHT